MAMETTHHELPPLPGLQASGEEWLGEVPEHWEEKPLKTVASLNDEVLPESLTPDYEIEYVDIGSVSLAKGIESTETMAFGDSPSRARRVPRDGDELVSTVRTYLKAIAPVVSPPSNLVASTGFAVVRPRPDLQPGFLKYALQEEHFIQQVISRSTGISYPAINASDIARISLCLPGSSEQEAIATFLDRETAKIDALITEQQRLIELLQEKRQAVISHAVTKGLNPDAPMKDSGVEWLGEVPEHWSVVPLKLLVKRGNSISYGIVPPGEPLEIGIPFVQTTNMSQGGFLLDTLQRTSPAIASNYPRSTLTGGEVLLGIRASIGAAHIAPAWLEGANLSRGVARIMPDSSMLNRFLVFYLRSESTMRYWLLAKQGSTFNEVSIDTVKNLAICVPPITEQDLIAHFAQDILFQYDESLAQSTRQPNGSQDSHNVCRCHSNFGNSIEPTRGRNSKLHPGEPSQLLAAARSDP